jgi:HSP20 family protein
MNNLTRFSPTNEPTRFDSSWNIDDLLSSFMRSPFARAGLDVEPQIKIDLKESEGKYLVKAEIPGVTKDDINVSVEGNHVSISAEVKQEKETKEGERVIRNERCYGTVSRSFTLADEVDQSQVYAKFNNGLLELTLPKKHESARNKILIS